MTEAYHYLGSDCDSTNSESPVSTQQNFAELYANQTLGAETVFHYLFFNELSYYTL